MATDRKDRQKDSRTKSKFSRWRERRRREKYTAKLTGHSGSAPSAAAQRARFESETMGRQGGLG